MIIIYSSNNEIPSGWLLCDGAAISRSSYSSLYSVISTTWGSGDGSTTFNLPNFNDCWLKGSSIAGSSVSAGLPNITGSVGSAYTTSELVFGAFSGYDIQHDLSGGSSATRCKASFSANTSNSIYGASTTVQPPSKTVRFIIKY